MKAHIINGQKLHVHTYYKTGGAGSCDTVTSELLHCSQQQFVAPSAPVNCGLLQSAKLRNVCCTSNTILYPLFVHLINQSVMKTQGGVEELPHALLYLFVGYLTTLSIARL
jgi:hypothetical protein